MPVTVPLLEMAAMSDHEFSRWLSQHGWSGSVYHSSATKVTSFLNMASDVIANVVYSGVKVKVIFILMSP